MKKLLAFVFAILSLMSVNLFAVEIRNVVDNGNGEYTVQRTSRGVAHTFHRAVDGSWTELRGADSAPVQVSTSFARTLNLELQAYVLGKNAQQQPLTAQPVTAQPAGQQLSQAPQPLPVPSQAAAAPQPQQEAKDGAVESEDDGMGIVPPVGDDPESAADLAGEVEHKRSRGDEVAAGAPQSKRNNIDYAEIGRLASIIFPRKQQPAGPQAGQEEIVKRNRIARAQALLESQYKKNQEQCILM